MLREQLNEAMKTAMRARDTAALGTIRLILAKLKDVDIAARTETSREGVADDRILSMLQGMIKQRNEFGRPLREGQPARSGRQGKGRDRRDRALPAQADGRRGRRGRRRRGGGRRRRQDGQGHGRRDGGAEGQVCRPDGLRQGVGRGEEGAGGIAVSARRDRRRAVRRRISAFSAKRFSSVAPERRIAWRQRGVRVRSRLAGISGISGISGSRFALACPAASCIVRHLHCSRATARRLVRADISIRNT